MTGEKHGQKVSIFENIQGLSEMNKLCLQHIEGAKFQAQENKYIGDEAVYKMDV